MFFLDPISSFLCLSANRRGARRALLHSQPSVLRYLRLLLGGDSIAILVMSSNELVIVVRMAGEYEHRHMIRRSTTPPALPALVRPRAPDWSEHIPAHDPCAGV